MSFDFISILGTELGRLGLTIWFFLYSMKPIKTKLDSMAIEMSKMKNKQIGIDKDIESIKEKLVDHKEDIKLLKKKVYNID